MVEVFYCKISEFLIKYFGLLLGGYMFIEIWKFVIQNMEKKVGFMEGEVIVYWRKVDIN